MIYKNFKAFLTTADGRHALQEMDCRTKNDHKTITCFIAREPGKRLEVHWENALATAAAVETYVNGRFVRRTVSWAGCSGWHAECGDGALIRTIVGGEESSARAMADVAIELRVYRWTPGATDGWRSMCERAHAALPLHTLARTRVACKSRRRETLTFLDKPENPYVRFVFCYGARDDSPHETAAVGEPSTLKMCGLSSASTLLEKKRAAPAMTEPAVRSKKRVRFAEDDDEPSERAQDERPVKRKRYPARRII
ncbi:hypothetical protein A0H81_12605 [Grifola frondosa]|uniref:Uncharacterized protein n=1 Tax=Grifola frondosa TaxID=5627 RepID=A0A1C7LRV7_GRIFR|nr:hypothetical protein A0H81_12605 [Grifola frondosa]